MNKLFLQAGLPRSGSTLLAALLNQNPLIYAQTSSFVEILWRNYTIWDEESFAEDFAGSKIQNIKIPYLKKITNAFFEELTDKPIVIDRRRHWHTIYNIKLYKEIFKKEPKIICTVRSIEEIASSYKNLSLANDKTFPDSIEVNRFGNRFVVPYITFKDVWNSEFKRCLLLVEYNDLVKSTQETLNKIYDFIEEPRYTHDLNNIVSEEPLKEREEIYGMKGMFNLPNKITKDKTSTDVLTSKQYKLYSAMNFWR